MKNKINELDKWPFDQESLEKAVKDNQTSFGAPEELNLLLILIEAKENERLAARKYIDNFSGDDADKFFSLYLNATKKVDELEGITFKSEKGDIKIEVDFSLKDGEYYIVGAKNEK